MNTSSKPIASRLSISTRQALGRVVLTAVATAALAACGGGGSDEPAVPPNELPTVSVNTPAANATVAWGQPIAITATAADSDGTIARVEFFDGTDKIGEDTTAPYAFTWTNAPAGSRVITARAVDNAGGSTISAGRTLVVSNQAPTVSLTTPAATVSSAQSVKITATAADTEGAIARVEFYDGATKLGEDTTAPYEFTWTGAAVGTHTLTARAIDGAGASTTSAAQSLAVVDVEAAWATLGAALQGGITTAPNKAVEAGGIDAIEVLTTVGTNKVAPIWRAAMAQAARSMATADFSLRSFSPCAGGGTMQVVAGAGTRRLVSFDNCVIGGFTFYGGVNVAPYSHTSVTGATPGTRQIGSTIDWDPTANGFTLTIVGVRVTGNGAPDAGDGDYPRNALVGTSVTCTGSGASLSCLTTFATGYNWGTDLAWDSFAAGPLAAPAAGPLYATDDAFRLNGTFRSGFGGAAGARNIRFEDFTQTSGRAVVYGSNGWSVVTRLAPLSAGVEQVQVKRFLTAPVTVGAVTYPAGAGPTERYRCEVATTGDWGCTLIVAP